MRPEFNLVENGPIEAKVIPAIRDADGRVTEKITFKDGRSQE